MSSVLKVDAIQNTGGTTGLTIDSNGLISIPNRVAGAFRNSASQTIQNTTSTKITLNSTLFNQNVSFDGSSNHRITIQHDGIYLVNGVVGYHGGAEQAHVGIRLNGGSSETRGMADEWFQNGDSANSSGQVSMQNCYILNLETNDYLELWAYHSSGGSMTTNQNRTYISIVKLA
tara:strand:- start:202 stop:723 length:522 start_codon:yes stop_codon:yes gene_type:complete